MLRPLFVHERFEAATRLAERVEAMGFAPPLDALCLVAPNPLHARPEYARTLGLARKSFDETVAVLEAARERKEFPAYLEEPFRDLLAEIEATKGCAGP